MFLFESPLLSYMKGCQPSCTLSFFHVTVFSGNLFLFDCSLTAAEHSVVCRDWGFNRASRVCVRLFPAVSCGGCGCDEQLVSVGFYGVGRVSSGHTPRPEILSQKVNASVLCKKI